MGRLVQSVAGQEELSVSDLLGNHNVIFRDVFIEGSSKRGIKWEESDMPQEAE